MVEISVANRNDRMAASTDLFLIRAPVVAMHVCADGHVQYLPQCSASAGVFRPLGSSKPNLSSRAFCTHTEHEDSDEHGPVSYTHLTLPTSIVV